MKYAFMIFASCLALIGCVPEPDLNVRGFQPFHAVMAKQMAAGRSYACFNYQAGSDVCDSVVLYRRNGQFYDVHGELIIPNGRSLSYGSIRLKIDALTGQACDVPSTVRIDYAGSLDGVTVDTIQPSTFSNRPGTVKGCLTFYEKTDNSYQVEVTGPIMETLRDRFHTVHFFEERKALKGR